MIVDSALLGPLTVAEDEVLRFRKGLFGLPDCRSFVLLPADREGLYWLQSVDHAELAFLLADPFEFFDGYSAEVTPADLQELGAGDASEVAVLAIVTLPESRDGKPTANLQGPLAMNLGGRSGKQLALQDERFGTRCAFDLLRPSPGR